MNFVKSFLLKLLEPLQFFLNKHNPPKVILGNDADFQEQLALISKKTTDDRLKELELQYHILTTKLFDSIKENKDILIYVTGLTEEFMSYFNDPATLEEETTTQEQPDDINKYGLN
jgi:hypothetical protein